MGRAIDQDNRLDDHERRLKLVEEALEEALDCAVYLAAKLIEIKNKRKEDIEWEEQ